MARRLGASIVVTLAMLLAVAACGDKPTVPVTPVAADATTPADAPTHTGAPEPTASPTVGPTPTRKPSPTATTRATRTTATTTTKTSTRPASTGVKAACTTVKAPLERAVSGLLTLTVLASGSSSDEEVLDGQIEASNRLLSLHDATVTAIGKTTDRTLQQNLRALGDAARSQSAQIRKPKPVYRELIVQVADTSTLENATKKLEPACGKYW
ncbi:hypothetical protein [Luedemannella helvata]|uniref:Lipoprotein n=1 Tax=Luedemannella helvata TaxID=349315 RepID=A0ABN2JZW9_9ACTN